MSNNNPIPPTKDRILDVFYFIGYASSAVSRLQDELSKLSIDPTRWSKVDREFIGSLALQAAHAMGEMAELCHAPMTDDEIAARIVQVSGWDGA
jgi:hypothetical protein